MPQPRTVLLFHGPVSRLAAGVQWLGEESAVELGLDPPATLASHEESKDVVALRYQGAAVLLAAPAGEGFPVEPFPLLERQPVVGNDDPTSVPECRPPATMRLPIFAFSSCSLLHSFLACYFTTTTAVKKGPNGPESSVASVAELDDTITEDLQIGDLSKRAGMRGFEIRKLFPGRSGVDLTRDGR